MIKRTMILSLVVLIAMAGSAVAVDYTWDGAVDNDFTNVLNWPGGIVPTGPPPVGEGAIISTTDAGNMPIITTGQSVGAAVMWTLYPNATDVGTIVYQTGSTTTLYNMGFDQAGNGGILNHDVQAGAVINIVNELSHWNLNEGHVDIAGTVTSNGTANGGFPYWSSHLSANKYVNLLPGGVLNLVGPVNYGILGQYGAGGPPAGPYGYQDVPTWVANGSMKTTAPGYHITSTWNPFTSTTSVFAIIPEPATLTLLGLGGVALMLFRRRKNS